MKKEIKIGETITPIREFKFGDIIVITSDSFKGNKEGTITIVVKSVLELEKENPELIKEKGDVVVAEAESCATGYLVDYVKVKDWPVACWYEKFVRPATTEEKRAFHKGIYSIYDM